MASMILRDLRQVLKPVLLIFILMTWVPLIDTGTTILRRLASGVALFQADRAGMDHYCHTIDGYQGLRELMPDLDLSLWRSIPPLD